MCGAANTLTHIERWRTTWRWFAGRLAGSLQTSAAALSCSALGEAASRRALSSGLHSERKKKKKELHMALNSCWLFCLLSLGCCGLSSQENPVSVELSCGAGPVHVVLEPPDPVLLDCHLGAADAPVNVTWLRDGAVLSESEAVQLLHNGSLLVLPTSREVEGAYSCLSGSSFGALTSRTVTLQLASLSRFLQDPEPQVVPASGTARFECQVDGLPVPTITWEKDQVPLPVPTEPDETSRYVTLPNGVLQILGVSKDDEGLYRCLASNSARKRYSQDASLTVTPGTSEESDVVITAPPQDLTVVLGQPAVLECMAQGQPKPFVSWSRQDGKPIATDVVVLATNLVIPDTHTHHAGVYVCRANKPKTREFVSASAEIRVLAPPVILQPPESRALSRANTARFVCNSSGDPAPVLRWLKNGEPVQWSARVKTQSPAVLLINQLGLEDAGYYQCIASNSLGTACATAKLSVIVKQGLPSPPRRLQATPHSSTSALLTWEPPEHNSDQVIGFSIHYQHATGSDNMEYQFAVNNDTTEFHVKELQPHTAYTFYMVAYSPMGASHPSQSVTVEMLEDVPSAPPQLSLLSTSPTETRVMWLPLSSQLSRGAITHYRIDYRTLEHADEVYSVEVGGNETQATLRDMKPNHTYQLRMAAGTRAGFGQPSEWAIHHTPNLTQVLFAPTELKVRAKMHSLHVTWQPPPNHTQITSYKLAYKEVDGEETTNEETPVDDAHQIRLRKRVRHYEITGLAPDRLYEVKVWACNKQTEGYPAVWKGRTEKFTDRVRLPDYLPPLPPSSVKARANSSTSIWLRWEKPPFSNVRIITYTIRCSPAGTRNASLVSYYTSTSQEILLGALKPFTRYELAVQSNGINMGGPFSGTVEESTLADRPSSPPTDLQLSAIDSFSVLVSWRPPLEPNGIIVSYRMLYSGNLSQPDHLWTNLSHDGSVTSTEVLGLMSGTRYYFKMGACTEVGVGPFSPVKDVHTPPKKYELDIHAVTGIIVGVCLGLLCILLCMCISFRNGKSREASGGLEPSALSSQYRRGGHAVSTAVSDCTDCHELETLMPPSAHDPALPLTEPNEQQSLMGSVGTGDDTAEPKLTWNGSVSRDWTNRITRYRDTITEDSPFLINGPLGIPASENSKSGHEDHLHSLGSNQVEAEVIVHSELSEAVNGVQSDTDLSLGSPGCQGPVYGEEAPPLSSTTNPTPSPSAPETRPPSPLVSNHTQEVLSNHSGPLESGGPAQLTVGGAKLEGVGLTNGFHSPESLRSGRESLENGDHRLCSKRKALSQPGLPPSPPAFTTSGLVQSTSGAHGYLCP
ncbi:immunoglobulin superfamily DCC subclass member 4 isoform X2 [Colossoma macropomum]|uniref:immunoglobulin superfamily DCC subclass member 4 isoform X2 n=1 Tax=Colossoma macropomum TaxID=42526 RepID=UPI001864BB04|nr:immunoglobulin superfamily DCC subclass member 4 isoform X2 [Colossoma macropomum]